ncbi:hypothetical protein LBMAG42_53060 [Deltaproteobacteria bacterium]|nr:hypothetical protein LBMAG42_53060 [Deltaproteobacteria bacterium]
MLLALTFLACPTQTGGNPTASITSAPGPLPQGTAGVLTSRVTADGLTQEEVDLDGDAKVDIINYYREGGGSKLLLKKDVDLNRDGRVDVRTSFDEAGLRVVEEMDGDFDGRADVVDHYIQGRRSMTEKDTDFNGSFDLFSYYEGGKVRRKERDSNADSKIDFWEYLDEAGSVIKTGKDNDGDGIMDERGQ